MIRASESNPSVVDLLHTRHRPPCVKCARVVKWLLPQCVLHTSFRPTVRLWESARPVTQRATLKHGQAFINSWSADEALVVFKGLHRPSGITFRSTIESTLGQVRSPSDQRVLLAVINNNGQSCPSYENSTHECPTSCVCC